MAADICATRNCSRGRCCGPTACARLTRRCYAKVKSIKPSIGVGWHIWHNNSFSPIYRAEQDLSELTKYSDFLKMVMYHNCGGERMASYIRSVGGTIYGDVPQQELLDFHYRVLDYKEEKPLAEIPKTRASPPTTSTARRSARREALNGTKTQLWPGIDIDIPTGQTQSKSQPGKHTGRGGGSVAGRRGRRSAFAQIFRDEAGEPARRGRSNQRGRPGLTWITPEGASCNSLRGPRCRLP